MGCIMELAILPRSRVTFFFIQGKNGDLDCLFSIFNSMFSTPDKSTNFIIYPILLYIYLCTAKLLNYRMINNNLKNRKHDELHSDFATYKFRHGLFQ